MARQASNKLLHQAKSLKSDEFYTLLEDIERELQFYKDFFRGKTVYCNCDDPRTSSFVKYFHTNFKALGLRKLIASCYVPQSSSLFDFDHSEKGFYCEVTEESIQSGLDVSPTTFKYFNGSGDFRETESINLLKEADIVVTNPPFSLFREFVSQLVRFDKKFLIIGNINAITYKEIFNLIQTNRVWLGVHLGRGISGFKVPTHYELYGTETHIDGNGNKIISPNNCLWLTNIDIPNRHNILALTKVYEGNEELYPKYDNYDGINVDKTQNIPMDYAGAIGVPITFLHKYNPNQFEIIQFRKGNDGKDLSINGKCPYFRILVKNKLPHKAADFTKSYLPKNYY